MSLRRVLAVVAGLYVIEGWPMGVFRGAWQVYFREEGMRLATIGAISGLYLAWSAKVLWSPLVDRFGEHRGWIAGALAVMAGVLWWLPAADVAEANTALWIALIVFCAASATQDIAIDAYTIGIVPRGEEGPANAVRITAYRVALVAAGGGLLLVADAFGWATTWRLAAGATALFAVLVWRAPRVAPPAAERAHPFAALARWISRPGALGVLGFVLLYRLGDLGLAPMLNPFWVDRGLSRAEIAWVSTSVGAIATVAGAIVGGGIVRRIGIGRALLVVGVLALGSNLGYAAAAYLPARTAIYAASLTESFCGGLAAAGFLAYLMRICEKEHAAVEYALLTALYALPGTFAGAVSGRAVELVGYGPYFAATAALALPAFAFLPAARRWLVPPEAARLNAAPTARSPEPGD